MRRAATVLAAILMMLALGGWAVSSLEVPTARVVRGAPVTTEEPLVAAESAAVLSDAMSSTTNPPLSTMRPSVDDNGPAALADSVGLPPVQTHAVPIGLTIGSLEVTEAQVRTAGVLANGEMEIPAPTEVGWYRYGPAPGEDGSAVLAAHIAASGVDGVFRHLDIVEIGAEVVVSFDDGTTSTWAIVERMQFDKDSLPISDLFARSGPPRLTLITCGGAFNPSLRSYEDNVIVTAVPA